MLAFLKGIYRIFRCIREVTISLFFILFVLAFLAFISLFGSESSGAKSAPFQKGALTLNLDGYLADNHDELGDLHYLLQSELSGRAEPQKISTFDVARAISAARSDERISGIVLDLSYFEGGDTPSIQFVGEALKRFKQSGKPVIATGELFSQKQYHLASFADEIYLNKAGMVELVGLSYSNFYFKSLFEKIEAVPHVFRVGTYKSAVEPFLRDDMSPEARENAAGWLNGLWANIRNEIAQNRGISADKLLPESEAYLEKFRQTKGDDAQFALQQGWVNEILTVADIRQKLVERFGKDEEGDYQHIDYFDYATMLSDRFNVLGSEKIAVVNVEGEIVWGEGGTDSAGSDEIVAQINQARRDESVLGLILRVNSPGGSVVASELIAQALEDLQKAGKPVVVSMGGMAASGGYWISAKADHIVAAPTTLTGSIGIFGLAMSFEQTAKKLGVSEDGVSTSLLAEQSALKPLNKARSELLQVAIENGYDKFIARVAEGRKMSKADVDKVAQGQVWLGEHAFEKGLVDQLGDFSDAYSALKARINQQRKQNNLPELAKLETQWLKAEPKSLLGQFMQDLGLRARLSFLPEFGKLFGDQLATQTNWLNKFNDPKQLYLYCLNCDRVE